MFLSYRDKIKFVQQLNVVNLIAHMASLISPHVKTSNLSSRVQISCFYSKKNPCNSLKSVDIINVVLSPAHAHLPLLLRSQLHSCLGSLKAIPYKQLDEPLNKI